MSKASTKELALIVHIWALKSYLTFYLTTLSMINITTYVTKFKLCPIYKIGMRFWKKVNSEIFIQSLSLKYQMFIHQNVLKI